MTYRKLSRNVQVNEADGLGFAAHLSNNTEYDGHGWVDVL